MQRLTPQQIDTVLPAAGAAFPSLTSRTYTATIACERPPPAPLHLRLLRAAERLWLVQDRQRRRGEGRTWGTVLGRADGEHARCTCCGRSQGQYCGSVTVQKPC